MDKDAKVKELLELIENEKRQPTPDKKQMRRWLSSIHWFRSEEEYRETYTGQDARFLTHTSMRTWRDDAER